MASGFADAVAGADGTQFAMAIAWFGLSIVAAAYNVIGFSVVRVRAWPTIQSQLAVCALRVVTPSAVCTPAITTRFLTRAGASVSGALATVGVAQTCQLVATVVVVAGLALVAGTEVTLPDARTALLVAGVLVSAAVLGAVAARVSGRVRRGLVCLRDSLVDLVADARRNPSRALTGFVASLALTLCHVLAFVACVEAVGGNAPALTLTAVYLGASASGSLVPTPGGVGAIEAAMVAGLVAAGIDLPAATAATVLARLVGVWIPAAPGWVALVALRRRGLL